MNPVLARESPEAMLAARQVLDRVVQNAAANADARGRFEDVAFRNTIANLPSLLREADAASLAGAFQGKPAIVLGAGPSLDANVEALRSLRVVVSSSSQPTRPWCPASRAASRRIWRWPWTPRWKTPAT